MKETPKTKTKLTDLEKADCLTGKMLGGIALKTPGFGAGKRRRFVFNDRTFCYHVMSRVKEAICSLATLKRRPNSSR